jgi:AGCS family alanine or glycine:cation symporter
MTLVDNLNSFIWGLLVDWILFLGIYLTLGLDFISLRLVPSAFVMWWQAVRHPPEGEGECGPFLNSMAALGGMIGMGNVTGVTAALIAGGPGVLVWIWIGSLVGFATKFAETFLATRYRSHNAKGEVVGGPMYYLSQGLPRSLRWLGRVFALFGALAVLGVGNGLQSEQIASLLNRDLAVPPLATGVVMAALTWWVIQGGLRRIGLWSAWLIPLSCLFYLVLCLVLVLPNIERLPGVLGAILGEGFKLKAMAGGTLGLTISKGIRLGVLSNEAGLGTSPIILSAGRPGDPFYQGCISMLLSLADVVVCTATALVVLCCGLPLEGSDPVTLLDQAFATVLGGASWLAILAVVPFAFTTFTAFGYYGERCLEFLLGVRSQQPFRLIWIAVVALASVSRHADIWEVTEVLNSMVALPNIIGILLLSGLLVRQTREQFARIQATHSLNPSP